MNCALCNYPQWKALCCRRMSIASVAEMILVIALVGGLSGCEQKSVQLQSRWSTTLRELGIVPVFPPREDLFVGDMYAYPFDPESEIARRVLVSDIDDLSPADRVLRSRLGMSARWSSVNLLNSIEDEYLGRPAWPESTPADLLLLESGGRLGISAVPSSDRSIFLDVNGTSQGVGEQVDQPVSDRVRRLRLVGFPEFTATSVSSGELSALVPLEVLTIGGIASISNVQSITVSIPVGESYSVSTISALTATLEQEYHQGFLVLHPLRFWLIVSEHMKLDTEQVLARTETLEDWQKERVRTVVATTADVDLALQKIRDLDFGKKHKTDLEFVAGFLAQKYTGSGVLRRLFADGQQVRYSLKEDHLGFLPLLASQSDDGCVYIRLITEVYYARAIDVRLIASSTFGSGLKGDVRAPLPDPGAGPGVTPDQGGFDQNAEGGESDASRKPSPEDRVRHMNRQLQATDLTGFAGGSLTFVAANDSSIGLRRVFSHPIAIGFRGLILKVDANGVVHAALPAGGTAPTVR